LLKLLSSRFGLPSDRMSIAGYAENAPIASNDTEEGRARNRRVDIVILNEQGARGELMKPELMKPEPPTPGIADHPQPPFPEGSH